MGLLFSFAWYGPSNMKYIGKILGKRWVLVANIFMKKEGHWSFNSIDPIMNNNFSSKKNNDASFLLIAHYPSNQGPLTFIVSWRVIAISLQER